MANEKKETKTQFLAKLRAMGPMDKATRNRVVCALLGHSRIQTLCFGYYNCARCGDQVGDNLASLYPFAEKAVVVGHNCDQCRESYAECTWQDKLYTPDPFKPDKLTRALAE